MEVFKQKVSKYNVKKRISWLLVIILIFGLIIARMTTVNADNDKKEFRILEIQPANSFLLKGTNGLTTTGIDTTEIKSSDGAQTYSVTIEHVSMPEFIGKVDQLNGKYDVIIIGRNENGITAPYRGYSAINNNGIEADAGHNSYKSGTNQLLPNGNYVENDITKRKAEEIEAFINSGQLVYINKTIYKNTTTLKNSNLQLLNSIPQRSNFITDKDESTLSLQDILNKYLEKDSSSQQDIINKRPIIKVENTSGGDVQTDYTKTGIADYVGSARKRNMNFTVNLPESTDTYTIKLFLDINGDGVFNDKECYKKVTVSSKSTYNLSYDIGKQFIGWLDWKVEVEKTNGVKSYVTGNLFFKKLTLDDIKEVRVLQVNPGSGLDLQNNTTFKNMVQTFNDKKDYYLDITNITADEFNGRAGKTTQNISSTYKAKGPLKLNGNYDMVIIGFSDSYNQKDITGDALDELQSFVKSGQSVMFTHDTMTFRMDESTTKASSIDLTKRFRDFVGQSRFIDKFRIDGKNTDAYQQYNAETEKYEERVIPHSDLVDANGNIQTTNSTIAGYALNGRQNITHTTKVYKTNTGLINNFPFTIGDISVALTHNQWYQLDLEDPDVVPSYNLQYDGTTKSDYASSTSPSGSKLNQYDSRNNYYTYSKGSITYSGTGHSQGYTTDEFKLFINTMIKAERGANHAPQIICDIPNETTDPENEIINDVVAGGTHSFTVDAEDLEHEMVNMHVTIDGEELSSNNINKELNYRGGDDINTKNDKVFSINTANIDREEAKIVIPDTKLQNVNDKVVIKIDATDIQGAKREKEYVLKAVKAPQFNVTADLLGITKVDSNNQPIASEVGDNYSIKVNTDDTVKVQYKVNPQQLAYGASDDYLLKDVAIIVDKSIDSQAMTSIANKIYSSNMFNNDNFIGNGNAHFDMITYGSGTVSASKDIIYSEDQINGTNIDYQLQLKNRLNNISSQALSAKDLAGALKVAKDDFSNYGRVDSSKIVIIISGKNPTGDITDLVSTAKADNYNVITLDMGGSSSDGQVKIWHNQLGGLPGDYYLSSSSISDDTINNISESLNLMKYKTYSIKSVDLSFNLGTNIDLVGDGLVKEDPEDEDSKKYVKNVPDIKYMATKQSDGSLLYKGYILDSSSDTNNQGYNLDFKIKASETARGNCSFGYPNKITYTNVINQTMENQIQTPILALNNATIEHGVYKKISNGKAILYKKDDIPSFAKESIVTFGANITGMDTTSNLKVNIDSKAIISEVPKAYEAESNGKLVFLQNSTIAENTDTTNPKEFEFKDFDGKEHNNIVILYSIKLSSDKNESETYINNIDVEGNSLPARVSNIAIDANPSKPSNNLPDLF